MTTRPSRFGGRWRQLLRLPRTVMAIARMIREDCSPTAADEHLWAFRGFHLEPSDPYYRARPWQKARLADIRPAEVSGLSPAEMAFMMQVAMEIEDPILEYSHQNGEGFRRLLPALGRFMGKNDEEAAYAAAHGLPWCESPWCAEERRHGNVFAKAIERLTGASPARDNPNAPRLVTADEEEALRHLRSRQAAEWSSSSTYVVMAAHASGSLRTLMRNVARDEIKHLCILAAADAYLLGPRRWVRFGELVKVGLESYREQRRHRTAGGSIGANAVTSLEVVVSHLLMEQYLQRWIAGVPAGTLAMIFETGDDASERRRFRQALRRWNPRAREAALRQRAFEEAHAEDLTRLIDGEFAGFSGAEEPSSPGAVAVARRIARTRPAAVRASLRAALRDYQIRHNRHVRDTRESCHGLDRRRGDQQQVVVS